MPRATEGCDGPVFGTCPRCGQPLHVRMMRFGPAILCHCNTPAGEYRWGRGSRRVAGGVSAADEAAPKLAVLRPGGR